MALETGTYISDLVSTNPVGTDTLDKADDHLRLLKSTIKTTFPNITGAVTATHTELNLLESLIESASGRGFMRNRIINGDMRIDQRNAGASVTPTASNTYTLDRWGTTLSQTSKFSVQQNAGAVTPPAGFKNYAGVTSLSAYSVLAGDFFALAQSVEGYNVADLGFGAAGAVPITISFWVRSSLTGSFGASVCNSAGTRAYPFTYAISAANTWEQKTVTIAGDTSGTWLADNGIGISVRFSLGCGATYSGTAAAWTASNIVQPTGSVSVVGTNAATWYVTGVQLEAGSAATPFERRQYGTELALCQRYYYRVKAAAVNAIFTNGQCTTTVNSIGIIPFPVTMRTAPTALEQSGTAAHYQVLNAASAYVASNAVPAFNGASVNSAHVGYAVASGLVAGNATFQGGANTSAYLGWSAEL